MIKMVKKSKATALSIAVIVILMSLTCGVSAEPAENRDAYDYPTVVKIMQTTDVNNLQASSSVIIEASTGGVILENDSHERLPVASITKLMTLYLAMEEIDSGRLKYEDMATVSFYARSMGGSQAYMDTGEKYTVDELLKCVAIHSANDAAVVLAEKISGSESLFADMMNNKAAELGMGDTFYLDCTGLNDEGQYSTAYDTSVLARNLITKHPDILSYTSTWFDSIRLDANRFDLVNKNRLINSYTGATGLKTGYTAKAGYCLVGTAERGDMHLIAIVLGEPDNNTRIAECRKMLDYGFLQYEVYTADREGTLAKTFEVEKGIETHVNARHEADVRLLIRKSEKSQLKSEVTAFENLEAPISAGDPIGEVIYTAGGKEAGRAVLVAETEVRKASFIRLFFRKILNIFRRK